MPQVTENSKPAKNSPTTRVSTNNTPTIFVNGNKFAGTGNTWAEIDQQLRALIDQDLAP
jgi:protein-disulfide isomerase